MPPQHGMATPLCGAPNEAREGGWGARWRFRIRCHGDRDRSPGLRLPQISRRLSSLVQDGRHRKTKGDCVRLKPPLALAAVGAGVGPPRERRRLSQRNRFSWSQLRLTGAVHLFLSPRMRAILTAGTHS
ncbi:hypothetical protein MRX96_047438 [Rhipicephalus microplus]